MCIVGFCSSQFTVLVSHFSSNTNNVSAIILPPRFTVSAPSNVDNADFSIQTGKTVSARSRKRPWSRWRKVRMEEKARWRTKVLDYFWVKRVELGSSGVQGEMWNLYELRGAKDLGQKPGLNETQTRTKPWLNQSYTKTEPECGNQVQTWLKRGFFNGKLGPKASKLGQNQVWTCLSAES